MDTTAIAVLAAAAATGGLSAAARRLGITPMAATRRLAALERELGVRLMQRTTRSLSLTPEGEAFLPFARQMIEAETGGRAVLAGGGGVSGLLRVTAPAAFGRRIVAPMIPALLSEHPGLRVDLSLSDAIVDIVDAGFDLAVRIARPRDNRLIARRLADNPRLLCASPEYARAFGLPRTLEDLERHECLTLSGVGHWTFLTAEGERRVRIGGRLTCDGIEGLRGVCLAGGGITLLAEWNIRDDLRRGALVPIPIAGARVSDLSIWAVYPTATLVPPKLRVFVAALERAIRS